jgi:hypothetical protein
MSLGKRLRDLAIETLIAVVAVTAYVVYLFERPKNAPPINFVFFSQVVNTGIVFGFVLYWFRKGWKKGLFWVVMACLFAGHLALYGFVISRLGHFPGIRYALLDAIECAVFSRILMRLPWNRVEKNETVEELP